MIVPKITENVPKKKRRWDWSTQKTRGVLTSEEVFLGRGGPQPQIATSPRPKGNERCSKLFFFFVSSRPKKKIAQKKFPPITRDSEIRSQTMFFFWTDGGRLGGETCSKITRHQTKRKKKKLLSLEDKNLERDNEAVRHSKMA